MKARLLLASVLFGLCVFNAAAGDICTFVNLGFSADSKSFMFGLYGVRDRDSAPYAEAYLVDVAANRFLPGGQLISYGSKPVVLGQDGSGALFNILHTIKPQIDNYRIDHLETGRLIYILVNGQEPKAKLQFRDFNTGSQYEVTLNQKSRPMGAKHAVANASEAEFNLSVNVKKADGAEKNYLVGRPGYYRELVDTYVIRQIILSPDEASLVIVIEKQDRSTGSLQTSYMVETLALK